MSGEMNTDGTDFRDGVSTMFASHGLIRLMVINRFYDEINHTCVSTVVLLGRLILPTAGVILCCYC